MTTATATESRHGPFRADSVDIPGWLLRRLLRNWARWLTLPEPMGPEMPKCRSAEGQYTSPQCWDERLPRPLEPNPHDAWRIETIVRYLPAQEARVLRVWYVTLGTQMRALPATADPLELGAKYAHVGSARRFLDLLSAAEHDVRIRLCESPLDN